MLGCKADFIKFMLKDCYRIGESEFDIISSAMVIAVPLGLSNLLIWWISSISTLYSL